VNKTHAAYQAAYRERKKAQGLRQVVIYWPIDIPAPTYSEIISYRGWLSAHTDIDRRKKKSSSADEQNDAQLSLV
jgi:hypothetical protein